MSTTPEYTAEALTEALASVSNIEVNAPGRNGAFRIGLAFADTNQWKDGDLQIDTLVAVRTKLAELGYKGLNISLSRRQVFQTRDGDKAAWIYSPSVWVNPNAVAAEAAQAETAALRSELADLKGMMAAFLQQAGAAAPAAEEPAKPAKSKAKSKTEATDIPA